MRIRLYICFEVGMSDCFSTVQKAAVASPLLVSREAANVECFSVKTSFCLQLNCFGLQSCCVISVVVCEDNEA